VENLNSVACEMPSSVVVQVCLVESLEYINSQMQRLNRRLEFFHADKNMSSSTCRGHSLKLTPILFSNDQEQFTLSLAMFNDMISVVEEELMTPVIQNFNFEFSTQPEDELEVNYSEYLQMLGVYIAKQNVW